MDDNEGLANANEVDEFANEPEPLTEDQAVVYMDCLMKLATRQRKNGAMASDAVAWAIKQLAIAHPNAPRFSDKVLAKIALAVMKVKKPVDPHSAMILAAKPPPKEVKANDLGELLRSYMKTP